MSELWCWQVLEQGEWGNIAAKVPGMVGWSVLVHRNRDIIEMMRTLAVGHHKATGLPIRLARYELEHVEVALP